MCKMLTVIRRKPVVSFFVLTYLISWLCWVPLIWGHYIYGWNSFKSSLLVTLFVFIGSFGPAISSFIITCITDGREGLKTLLGRLVKWRFSVLWWLLAVFFWVIIFFFAARIFSKGSFNDLLTGFANVAINLIVYIFFIGPIGEELGWRGFALDNLLKKYNALSASFLIGIVWAFWHTPLALFLDDWRNHMPLAEFAMNYILLVIPLSVVFTWFYKQSKGSVLLCMVLHASYNYNANSFINLFGLGQLERSDVNWIIVGLVMMFAICLIAYGKNLYKPQLVYTYRKE